MYVYHGKLLPKENNWNATYVANIHRDDDKKYIYVE